MKSLARVLWQAMRGVEQRAGDGWGKRSGTERSNRSQRPRIKQEEPHKDQVSQASAEKLHFQESWRGNDWKRGEKIESDSQKENEKSASISLRVLKSRGINAIKQPR